MVGGRINKQGNLLTRLVFEAKSSSPPLLARILKAFTEALSGFRHTCCPESLSNTLFLQGCLLENGSKPGNGGQSEHFKDTGGVKVPPISQVQLAGQSAVTSSLSSLCPLQMYLNRTLGGLPGKLDPPPLLHPESSACCWFVDKR